VISAALARTTPSYAGLVPPYGPGAAYPELGNLLGSTPDREPPNAVYAAVRSTLRGLGLDGDRYGSEAWNPLGDLARRGARIVLKPNFIRHWNPGAGTTDSVITHGSILRVIADYSLLAAGPEGSVAIAEAPQQDCDFDRIRDLCGIDTLVDFYRRRAGRVLEVIDLRREAVEFRDGIIVRRRALPGDPAGYRVVDLGAHSFFAGSGLDPQRFRGADYDPGPTGDHHSGGRHAYLLSETVLRADLVVNLPKVKTHKKTGVTLALKNLVGINGDKNWLPHHCVGAAADGGDEFPGGRVLDRLRSRAVEWARPHLARARFVGGFRAARRLEGVARGSDFIRSGNWYGNRTTWRMCLDLNRCLYYSDAKQLHLDAGAPVRRVLTVLDGVVAGEGEGPLAPSDVPLGAVIASCDPVAADLVAIRLMGFDERRVPKVAGAMRDEGPRITEVRSAADVRVVQVGAGGQELQSMPLDAVEPAKSFAPHPGWRGHLEREST
jgi:uncharacterized protein (DUF362 family)